MKFLKYLTVVTVVITAAAIAAVMTGGVDLPDQARLVASANSPASSAEPAVAIAAGEVVAYNSATGSGTIDRFAAVTEYGTKTSFSILADHGDRLEVRLPGRPSGRIGFVDSNKVITKRIDTEIDVDLASRTLRLTKDHSQVLEAPIAIGSERYPTPVGDYFITDVLASNDPVYGPWALGISAWSDVLTEFNGGSGQIGLHGTNKPSSIGKNISHGCVRVKNDVIEQLAKTVEVGTIVRIH